MNKDTQMEKEVVIKKLLSLANNLNGDYRKFKNAGHGKHYATQFDKLTDKYDHKAKLRTKDGNLSRSAIQFNKLSLDELTDLYNTFYNLKHSKMFGNLTKYEKEIKKRNEKFDQAYERITGKKPDFKTEEERRLFYDSLDQNRRSGKTITSGQIILQLYTEIYAPEEEQEELKETIRKREKASKRMEKFKVGNKLPQRGGNKR